MTDNPHHQRISDIYNGIADVYSKYDTVAQEINRRLCQRLSWIKVNPEYVVDLGAGTGRSTLEIKKQFPQARVVMLDLVHSMLNQVSHDLPGTLAVCAAAEHMPLAERSVDLIISNMLLPWVEQANDLFKACYRLLKPNGLFLFSSLGPDTLAELQLSMAQDDEAVTPPSLIDMHLLGDSLRQAGFSDPVVDVERLTLLYPTLSQLFRESMAFGGQWLVPEKYQRMRALDLKKGLKHYRSEYCQDKQYLATLEVIYGYARAPAVPTQPFGLSIPIEVVSV